MEFRIHKEITIPVNGVELNGELIIPSKADGIIIFSHGSGSSRFSPRNQIVARYLHQKNFGTLLFDLLTEQEDTDYMNRFNIELLTERLIAVTIWLEKQAIAKDCQLGYFGASTGAASALRAAASLPQIAAVVSRGGRPDLAMDLLPKVKSPTLLIIGGLDYDVLKLNNKAYFLLECERRIEIVKGASHLFEEPGAMEKVCEHAANWFEKYLLPVKTTHYVG